MSYQISPMPCCDAAGEIYNQFWNGCVRSAAAIMGPMRNVTPILHLNREGQLVTAAMVRGSQAALDYLVQKFMDTATDLGTVFVTRWEWTGDVADLETLLREKCGIKNLRTRNVAPGIISIFRGTK